MQTGIQEQNSYEHKVMLEFYRFREVHELFSRGLIDDARIALAELQQRYITLCDENNVLKQQVREFEDVLHLSRNLVFDGSVYWLITGKIKQGPFCQDCYNSEGLLIRLTDSPGCRQCGQCSWKLQPKTNGGAGVSGSADNQLRELPEELTGKLPEELPEELYDDPLHNFEKPHCLSELDPLLGRAKIIAFGDK